MVEIPEGVDPAAWRAAVYGSARTVRLQRQGQTLWLKKSAPARGTLRYRALDWVSYWLDAPMLRPVPQPGGSAALATERRRLYALSEAGVLVPEIIAWHREWLLISDLGETAVIRFRACRGDPRALSNLLGSILDALAHVHDRGQYLSQGFVRNILFPQPNSNIIGFIDFEDDPLESMSLPMAQARDLLLLVYSVSRYFGNDRELLRQMVRDRMNQWPDDILYCVDRAVSRLRWLRQLPARGLLGKDCQRLLIILDTLSPS